MKRITAALALAAFVVALAAPLALAQGSTAPATTPATPPAAAPAEKPMKAEKAMKPMHAEKAAMAKVDINSASKEDLMKLPGITDETAQKIVDGRPYKTKADLTKKSILTKAEYGKVRNRIVARQEKSAEMKSDKAPETKAAETTTPEAGK